MRLAYADPPYPGKAHLYPENTEVDHAELVARLCEYDGWALSTDERNLRDVLALCPPRTRVLAWCRKSTMPLYPYPVAAWEPVLMQPARTRGEPILSYLVCAVRVAVTPGTELTGQKPPQFNEWVIRCLGAKPEDSMHDLFPGTGGMGAAWHRFRTQLSIPIDAPGKPSGKIAANRTRRANTVLDGMTSGRRVQEGNRA